MTDIYQAIWDADQAENGIRPILDTDDGDDASGFVSVNSRLSADDPALRVLPEAVIPPSKRPTYDLCLQLFDNYALRERDEEIETPAEREEVHELVQAMIETAPMEVAREYVATQTGTGVSRERWYTTIMEMWFRRFTMGGDPDLSGFEHVVVGEQEGSKAQGYHFWYKYYLDDGFAGELDGDHSDDFPNLPNDRIAYLGSRMATGQRQFPETVTISYRWLAPDYDRGAMRPLTKPTGGFFVGCSVEGLLAIGTIRAHRGVQAPTKAVINGAKYSLAMYTSQNGRHVRTFYPKFLGEAPAPGDEGGGVVPPVRAVESVRLVAALVNPEGHDPGLETVTLLNRSASPVSIEGWSVVDRNQRATTLGGTIGPGDAVRVRLDGRGAQLSNSGGEIRLRDASGTTIHFVTYSRAQARKQGTTIVF